MARKRVLFKMTSKEGNRYSIAPLPEEMQQSKTYSENIRELIERVSPSLVPTCAKHPENTVTWTCKTCNDQLICEQCLRTGEHAVHSLEDINTTYQSLVNYLKTAKKNIDRINAKFLIASDENQNEENEIRSQFEKLKDVYYKENETILMRLKDEENQLEEYDQGEMKTINFSKEADQRLYEVEAIEELTELEQKMEYLEQEKKSVQERLEAKFKERDSIAAQQLEALQKELEAKKQAITDKQEGLGVNENIFQRVCDKFKEVTETHANNCRESITSFVKSFGEINAKITEADNGLATVELLQDLCSHINHSRGKLEDVSNESFVVGIPNICYTPDGQGSFGHFTLHPAEEETVSFNLHREAQKGWSIENISGVGGQRIDVISRKRGGKECYLDILDLKGNLHNSHKLSAKSAEAVRFVCGVGEELAATCCENEISVINIQTGNVEASQKLNRGEEAWQIAYNSVTNEIVIGLVGTNELRVYNEKLDIMRSVEMQDTLRAPLSLSVHGSNIFVCTFENRAFILDGKDGKVKSTFSRKGIDNRAWRICFDPEGMIYVMWLLESGVIRVIRYNTSGQELSSLDLDCDVRFLSFAHVQKRIGHLVVATAEGKLHVYRTPTKIEDDMVRAVYDAGLAKSIRVMSVWKPI